MSVSTRLAKVHQQKHLSTAHPGLYTVSVRIEDGYFVVEHDDGATAIRNGHDLAASMPPNRLYGGDIRIWIDRPVEPAVLERLRDILRELADWTGAVVWGPPAGGYCDVIPACADLSAFHGDGTTALWHYYQPEPDRPLRYSTDPDGRLVPAGGLVLQSCPTVALISIPGPRLDGLVHRYADLPPREDQFLADLTVLEDGRPAACCADGTLFVLGPRALVRILNAHGWTGQEIALLADLDPTQQAGLRHYVDDLNTALGRRISIVAAGELPPVRRHPTMVEIGERLASMVEGLIHELPSLQQQFRMLAADQSRRAAGFDIWLGLLRCLVEARYSPSVRELWAGRRPAPEDDADALVQYSALADANATAREFVGGAERAAPAASNLASSDVDARWDKQVRPLIGLALNHLDPADPTQASQLRQLTQALMALATLTSPSRVAPARALDDARAVIERAVLAAGEAPESPADAEPTQLVAATTEAVRPEMVVQATPAEVREVATFDTPEPATAVVPQAAISVPQDEARDEAPAVDLDAATAVPPKAVIADAAESDVDPYEAMYGPDPTRTGEWTAAATFLARPHLEPTTRKSRPHGLSWLPDVVQANDDVFELFVGSDWSPERVADLGFPSARLFLVGHLDAQHTNAAHSVRVRVERQGAIDLLACGAALPPDVRLGSESSDVAGRKNSESSDVAGRKNSESSDVAGRENSESSDVAYILPAGWLDRCYVILDETDGHADGSTGRAVLLRSWGASHGIDGLPEEVVWGPRGLRRSALAYAVLTDHDTAAKNGLRLYRDKPAATAGRLVELRVGSGMAIDIDGSEAKIKGFPGVRTILPELRDDGVDMLLPSHAFEEVKVTGDYMADGQRWKPTGRTLAGTLASLLA